MVNPPKKGDESFAQYESEVDAIFGKNPVNDFLLTFPRITGKKSKKAGYGV